MTNKNKLLTALIIWVLILFSATADVFAEQDLLFKVNHVAGVVEKLTEKIALVFKFDKKSKAEYYQYLAEKRLLELAFVIDSNQIDSVEPTASRYTTYIGNLTNYVLANKVTQKKDDLIEMFDRHIKITGKLQQKFKMDSGWWIAIQHDINSAKLFQERIKNF